LKKYLRSSAAESLESLRGDSMRKNSNQSRHDENNYWPNFNETCSALDRRLDWLGGPLAAPGFGAVVYALIQPAPPFSGSGGLVARYVATIPLLIVPLIAASPGSPSSPGREFLAFTG